ncbi:histidine kinase-like ATPase [Kickxella alabastrina]|uniref:histidine kinase-like ATPase n=1 Tax=Kickxella alabastrina TaxID=61397 RepID=UPI00221F1779|nr:histidine kinase-like ATPase [Kickxella alabastrina]KAI7832987.1 histidine kinase-like ATPase [Kickxella alabastrina]KAJ1943153.1 hypothetical protein GGF37_002776 [Kickxella alabastrina]
MPSADQAGSISKLSAETSRHIQSAYEISSPLCVVQELVRNSTEAASNKISVQISANGLECIQVSDNGPGIEQDGLSLLAQRGCTSKLKICTRTQTSEAGSLIVINSSGHIVEKKYVASNPGTTVTVVQPLVKLRVRYDIAKARSAQIKREIRRWLVAFCLANYHVGISMSALGMEKEPRNDIAFSGSLSLMDAVLHFIGAIPRLCVSISGISCKPDISPGLLRRLLQAYSPDSQLALDAVELATTNPSKCFLGVLNVIVPLAMLDTSLRIPWLLHAYDVECIEADVIEKLHTLAESFSGDGLMRPIPTTGKCQTLLEWFQGNCGTAPHVALYRPRGAKRKAPQPKVPNLGKNNNSSIIPNSSYKQPIHLDSSSLTSAPNNDTLSQPVSDIPQAKWCSHSAHLNAIISTGTLGHIVCLVTSDGTMHKPQSPALSASASDIALCLVWAADTFVALDARGLGLLPDPITNSSTFWFVPKLKAFARLAQINYGQ